MASSGIFLAPPAGRSRRSIARSRCAPGSTRARKVCAHPSVSLPLPDSRQTEPEAVARVLFLVAQRTEPEIVQPVRVQGAVDDLEEVDAAGRRGVPQLLRPAPPRSLALTTRRVVGCPLKIPAADGN